MKTMALFAAGLIAAVGIYSGCETTRGFGEDVQNTGTNIQRGVKSVDPNVGNTTDDQNQTQQDRQHQDQNR